MIIYAYAHDEFDNYPQFMRGITVAIESNMIDGDNKIEIWCGGPHSLNDFTAEYVNKTMGYFKQKKIKIRYHRMLKNNMLKELDNTPPSVVLYFGTKDYEPFFDSLMSKVQSLEIPTRIYKGL